MLIDLETAGSDSRRHWDEDGLVGWGRVPMLDSENGHFVSLSMERAV